MSCTCGSKWSATLNKQPIEKPRLHVEGQADCRVGSSRPHLKKHQPQGINPRILLLDLLWHEQESGGSVHAGAITVNDVTYDENPSPDYDEVVIVNCGDKKIKVHIIV
jgi:hypothetical protein